MLSAVEASLKRFLGLAQNDKQTRSKLQDGYRHILNPSNPGSDDARMNPLRVSLRFTRVPLLRSAAEQKGRIRLLSLSQNSPSPSPFRGRLRGGINEAMRAGHARGGGGAGFPPLAGEMA